MQRLARGLRLGYPEAMALIRLHVLEGACAGHTAAELVESARRVLGLGDVLPGVAELLQVVRVEAPCLEGTTVVSIHDPLGTEDAGGLQSRSHHRGRSHLQGRTAFAAEGGGA